MAASRLGLYYVISHTTRPKRSSETQGGDYYFVDHDTFHEMIDRGEFLEHAIVYDFHYGTSKKIVSDHLKKGQGVILDLDHQGALAIKKLYPYAVLVFVRVPSKEELLARLSKRGTESDVVCQKRIQEAYKEESYQKYYDEVIVNEDLEKAYEDLARIINKTVDRRQSTVDSH